MAISTINSPWTTYSSTGGITTFVLIILPLTVFGYVFSGLASLFLRQARSPLRHLRGPPAPSLILGNLTEMHEGENAGLLQRWEDEYGPALVYRGFVGGRRLLTTDPRAVAHILGNAYDYPKPDFIRDSLATMAAGTEGLLVVEGEQHRRLRRILTPAFTTTHIKALAPVFWEKAVILRDIWVRMSPSPSSPTSPSAPHPATPTQVDVLAWLIRATLDAMGLAGFGYSFDALTNPDPDADELAAAFATIFSSARKLRLITVFQAWFPVLRRFRPDRRVMDRARATMDRIGSALIAERTEHVLAQKTATSPSSTSSLGTTTVGRDLLSVMVKSSLSEEPSRRLSSSEALCQISTFLLAGHETTSNALSWSLYALARNSTSQAKLRAELRSVPIADPLCPSPDEVDAIAKLEYLDAVLRECLRLHAPVTSTMRVCARDADEVPVSEPFMDRHGQLRTAIPLKRGDIVSVPLQAVNCSRKIWGPDADEFRPERWAGPPVEAQAVPGVWANILTFLNGNALNGNRGCIGWRFALLEMKLFLFVLVRDLDFGIDSDVVVDKRVNVVTRPFVRGKEDMGNQMPLFISRALP